MSYKGLKYTLSACLFSPLLSAVLFLLLFLLLLTTFPLLGLAGVTRILCSNTEVGRRDSVSAIMMCKFSWEIDVEKVRPFFSLSMMLSSVSGSSFSLILTVTIPSFPTRRISFRLPGYWELELKESFRTRTKTRAKFLKLQTNG